jgi:hypothetical protein
VQKLQRSQFGRRAERLDDDQLQFGFEDLEADLARAELTFRLDHPLRAFPPSLQPRSPPRASCSSSGGVQRRRSS